MLTFTPQIQKALGDAVLIADGDVLYIVNRHWMLVVAQPERFVDREVLDIVRDFDHDHRWHVNWRILCAREIDFAQNKFLPHKSRKFIPIATDCWHELSDFQTERLRYSIEERYFPSLWGDLVNLSDLFNKGQARASYRERKIEGQKFAKRPNAQTYQFRFDDKLVCVSADWWRAFEELGLTVVCPREGYLEDQIIPHLGLRSGEGFDVAGIFRPEATSGVKEDAKGRKLYTDAAIACWIQEGQALKMLTHPQHYSVDCIHSHPGLEAQTEVYHSEDLRRAISALRWKGWSDHDLESLYEDNRQAAYLAKKQTLNELINALVEELPERRMTSWALKNAEHKLERYCELMDKLNRLLGSDDIGRLPEAVALLTDLLDPNNTSPEWRT